MFLFLTLDSNTTRRTVLQSISGGWNVSARLQEVCSIPNNIRLSDRTSSRLLCYHECIHDIRDFVVLHYGIRFSFFLTS